MSLAESMQVTLRLPTRTLFEGSVQRLFATAQNGAFGMLPNCSVNGMAVATLSRSPIGGSYLA